MAELKVWDEENEILDNWYHTENLLIKEIGNGNVCYIFFSSNDIYYPNTIEAFDEKIVLKNRFEWTNMAESNEIKADAGRFIFVRDLYKQWYVTGINSRVNTHDRLIDELRTLSKGYIVRVVGSSAGGYASMLVGGVLNAEECFVFSGQTELGSINKDFCYRMTGSYPEELKYYDIKNIIRNSKCSVYYFYPMYCHLDREVFNSISDFDNVYGFGFDRKEHAVTMLACNMRFVISKNTECMKELWKRYDGKVIGILGFFIDTVPFYMWIPLMVKEVVSYMKRLLK